MPGPKSFYGPGAKYAALVFCCAALSANGAASAGNCRLHLTIIAINVTIYIDVYIYIYIYRGMYMYK